MIKYQKQYYGNFSYKQALWVRFYPFTCINLNINNKMYFLRRNMYIIFTLKSKYWSKLTLCFTSKRWQMISINEMSNLIFSEKNKQIESHLIEFLNSA